MQPSSQAQPEATPPDRWTTAPGTRDLLVFKADFKADALSVTEKSPLLPQRPAQQWTSPVPSSIDPDLVGGSSSGTPDLKTQEAGHRRLLLAVTAAMMATMSYGLSVGYTSPALPDIRQRMDLSDDQSDWFGSLLNIGGIFGALAGGKLDSTTTMADQHLFVCKPDIYFAF